jgi:mono/diheme cytochrome c family protein
LGFEELPFSLQPPRVSESHKSRDTNRQVRYLSDECYRVLGLGRSDGLPVVGPDLVGRIHPDDRERVLAILSASIEGAKDFELECRSLGPDGGTRDLYVVGHPGARPQNESLNAPFTLVGRDLYRLDCRSCHGPDGRGAPPEINSILDPVRATSAASIEERQRDQGRHLPRGMSQQLAAEANKALLDRIANGGKKMPPFRHLAGDEVTALVEYVKTLAGIPAGEQHPRTVTESVVRAGEHLVKGTCHVCHPATGPGPSHMMMYMRGVIPSLASMPQQMSPAAVLGKVRAGAYGGIGMMARTSRMPVFGYLTDEEVMAAYIYLSRYSPVAE